MNYTPDEYAKAAELYPSLWVKQHEIKNEVGVPIEFEKRKFLKDIYDDLHPFQVILKPPQVGMTVCNTLKIFYVAKKLGRQVIYTLPTQSDIQVMVGGSFNRIIAQNTILQEWVKDHDTVEQKTIGDSMIFYRGTYTTKQAMMIPAGLLVHDELDSSDLEVITMYQTRLQAQEDGGWTWVYSHPSLTNMGVDVYWQKSDKREWVITCPSCKQEQVMSWPTSVSREKKEFVCKSCNEILPTSCRVNGYWYATAQGEYHGYHISQLMLYNKTAQHILDAFDDPLKDKQYFYNYVLGLPYQGGDDQITSEQVLKNCTDTVNAQTGKIIIGVDPGLPVHYVAMNTEGVFYFNVCKPPSETDDGYEDIRKLMRMWPQAIVISDQGGDLNPMRKMQFEFPGRVFLAFYRKPKKTQSLWEWGEGEDYGQVVIDRNRTIQSMIEQFKEGGRFKLNGTAQEFSEYADHFASMYREKIIVKEAKDKDDRSLYGAEYVWKRRGADHWCFVAGTKITTKNGDRNIEEVAIGDYVLTRKGYQRVYSAGLTRVDTPVVTAYFSNGASFTCTPDHPLITKDGSIRVDSITRHAILYACKNQKVLYTKGLLTDDTRILQDEKQEFTLYPTGLLGQKGLKGFISKFGLMPMAISLKGMSFIIKMAIRLTTNYLTWCVRHELFTTAIIQKKNLGIQITEQIMYDTWHESGVNPTRGEQPPTGDSGIENMLIRALCYKLPLVLNVLSVVQKLLHEAIRAVSSVRDDVQIVGLHENIERKDVINLSVENEHEYFANGILVSNCHCTVYAMVGMEKYGQSMAKVTSPDFLSTMKEGLMDDKFTGGVILRSLSDDSINF